MTDFVVLNRKQADLVTGLVKKGFALAPRKIDGAANSDDEYAILPVSAIDDEILDRGGLKDIIKSEAIKDVTAALSTSVTAWEGLEPLLNDVSLASWENHTAPTTPFKWLETFQFTTNAPDWEASYGISHAHLIGGANFGDPPYDTNFVYSEADTETYLNANPPTSEYVLMNIEAWALPSQRTQYEDAIDHVRTHLATSTFDATRTSLGISAFKIGYYSRPPDLSYTFSESYKTARENNELLLTLGSKCDFVCPSFYVPYATWTTAQQQILCQDNIYEARLYGKPVLPFLWVKDIETESLIVGSLMEATLDVITDTTYGSDGAVWWSAFSDTDWNGAAGSSAAAWQAALPYFPVQASTSGPHWFLPTFK